MSNGYKRIARTQKCKRITQNDVINENCYCVKTIKTRYLLRITKEITGTKDNK